MPCLSLQLKYRLPFLSLGTNGPKKNHYCFHPPWMILGECYLESALYKGKGYTLQEINISHLGKRKIIFKMDFCRGYVSSQENIHFIWNHSWGFIQFQCHFHVFFCGRTFSYVKLQAWHRGVDLPGSRWIFGENPGFFSWTQLLYRCITAQNVIRPVLLCDKLLVWVWDPVYRCM